MWSVRSEASLCPSVFGAKGAPFLLVQGGHLSHEGLMTCSRAKVRKSFPHLPFLKFLQLEIFCMTRCRILG